jgi:hypothetical protein
VFFRNIKVNVVAPGAGSRMTDTVLPREVVERWRPEHVAPIVAYLASEFVRESGCIFEAGGGWFSQVGHCAAIVERGHIIFGRVGYWGRMIRPAGADR